MMRTTAISSGPADREEPWHIPTQQAMTHLLENPHPEDVCPQSQHRGRTSRRRPSTLEVSGISALAKSDDEEDHPLARPRQKTRYQPSPLDEEEDLSQDNEPSNSRAKKNKRPLNGPSVAKNRRCGQRRQRQRRRG